MARARRAPKGQAQKKAEEFTCPECGRTFSRAAALGAHRRQAHGVVGATSRTRQRAAGSGRTRSTARSGTGRKARPAAGRTTTSTRSRAGSDGNVDRDGLLRELFPNGIPANEGVIRAVNGWLDEAERLARMR